MKVATNPPTIETGARWAAAALVLGGGLVHLKLRDGIADWPNDNLSRMFLLNVVASVAAAVAVAVWDHWIPIAGALALQNGTLFMFGLSRTDTGVPLTSVDGANYVEAGFDPSPEALLAVLFEVGAVAVLVYLLYTALSTRLESV